MLDGRQRLILAGQPVTLPLRDLLISVQEIFCEIFNFRKIVMGLQKGFDKIVLPFTLHVFKFRSVQRLSGQCPLKVYDKYSSIMPAACITFRFLRLFWCAYILKLKYHACIYFRLFLRALDGVHSFDTTHTWPLTTPY